MVIIVVTRIFINFHIDKILQACFFVLINTSTKTDCDEVAILADISKAILSVYRVDSQFPMKTMFLYFIQSIYFIHFEFNNVTFQYFLHI